MMGEDDEVLLRAGWIIRDSRVARLCGVIASRSSEGFRTSRTRAIVCELTRRFQSIPAAERTRWALSVTTIALAGHVLMTGLLPLAARPLPAFSTPSLLGAVLAVGIVTRRPRS